MRVTSKSDLCPVVLDINGEKRQLVEDIADIVLRNILEEDEMESTHATPAPTDVSLTSASTGEAPLPLSIAQLLSTSPTSQPSASLPPATLTPFQLALYSTLLTSQNNVLFPGVGGPSSFLPLFVPPPPPQEEEPTDFLKMMADILSKQQRK